MGVSRRSRVPERITRPDERFDSSQVGLHVPNCELFAGRAPSKESARASDRSSVQANLRPTDRRHTLCEQLFIPHQLFPNGSFGTLG